MFGRLSKEQRLRRTLEDVLVGAGFSEAYTPSLVAEDMRDDALRLPIPLTAEAAVLRTMLVPSLAEAAERNREFGNDDVALFEIARVYLPSGEQLPEERWRLGAVVEGGYAPAKTAVDLIYAALKIEERIERGRVEGCHPGRTAILPEGWIGQLVRGGWGAFELDLAALAAAMPEHVEYRNVIGFPAVRQDLAFIVPEAVTARELAEAMRTAAGSELREVEVFDEYRSPELGEGRKSVAFAVAFQSPLRTLTDEDAAGLRARIVEALKARFGAELRA
jgi:phenylalanyl-tRNA synthetase beta chain